MRNIILALMVIYEFRAMAEFWKFLIWGREVAGKGVQFFLNEFKVINSSVIYGNENKNAY